MYKLVVEVEVVEVITIVTNKEERYTFQDFHICYNQK